MNNSKVSMIAGRAVLNYDWSKASGDPLLLKMARANGAAIDAIDASRAKLERLASDQNFSQTGRQNQIREWFWAEGLPALREGRAAVEKARDKIDAVRGEMKASAIDKHDAAGAILRSEIRAWLRGMEGGKRTAMLAAGDDLDPTVALAIQEAPAELSGVTREQRTRLEERAALAQNPEAAEKIATIEEATEALASTLRAASLEMMRDTGYAPRDIDRMLAELEPSNGSGVYS